MSISAEQEKNLAQRYKMVFGTDDGKAVLEDILTACHVLGPVDSISTNQILIMTGMRNAGLDIARKAKFDINQLIAVGGE
jgi:hypothetical protein